MSNPTEIRMQVRETISGACGCLYGCQDNGPAWETRCGCLTDADNIIALVAPAAAAAEREACAQIAEGLARHAEDTGFRLAKSRTGQDKAKAGKAMAQRLAIAIRARTSVSEDEPEAEDQTP